MYEITTGTYSGTVTNTTFNIYNIGEFLKITEPIIGLKYYLFDKTITKGNGFKTDKTFRNQVNIIYQYNLKNYNIKLFKNGSYHITGCKTPEIAKEIIISLVRYLRKADTHQVINDDALLYNKYSHIIGKRINNTLYNINNHLVILSKLDNECVYTSHIILPHRLKHVYNMDGIHICDQHIKLKTRKKLYSTDKLEYDVNNNLIYLNNKIVGEYEYINWQIVEEINAGFYINCTESKFDITLDINCINIKFSINKKIVLLNMAKYLLHQGYNIRYNPEKYAGIKFIYKDNIEKNGKCICKTRCLCKNITFLIFSTGQILGTGFQDISRMDDIYKSIQLVFEQAVF